MSSKGRSRRLGRCANEHLLLAFETPSWSLWSLWESGVQGCPGVADKEVELEVNCRGYEV